MRPGKFHVIMKTQSAGKGGSRVKNLKTALTVLLAVFAVFAAVMVFVHRKVIWKAVKGEPVGECPRKHAKHCFRKKKKA